MINFNELFNKTFGSGKYTLENTFLYSFLYILTFFLLYILIKNKKVVIDKYFNINLIISFSIIVLIRVAMDFGWIKEIFLLYTPYMQILVLSLFSINLINNEERKKYFYFYSFLLIATLFLFIKKIPNILIIPLIFILILIFYIFYKENKRYYFVLPILSNFLDGFYGNFGIYFFGYSPKHVIHTVLLNYFGFKLGIFVFLLLKSIILVLTILLIEIFIKETDLKEILYLMLFYVGYNAGLRNALLVSFNEI